MSEFELIAHIRARAPRGAGVVLGIGDDAAVLRLRPGHDLVATTDSLVAGVHFNDDFAAADIGHLALAANLSDLAAMGAVPRWVLLSLTWPRADREWLDGFLDGFLALASRQQAALVGGNLARGPGNVTVQALGEVPRDRHVTRAGARPGDRVVVTGTLGDAAAALELGRGAPDDCRDRLRRAEPRVRAGLALAPVARAMVDLSDGLLADLAHLLTEDVGACIELDKLPASAALLHADLDRHSRWRLQLGGGSDYELCAILPADGEVTLDELSQQAGVPIHCIGRVDDGDRIRCRRPDGGEWHLPAAGWDHFREQ